MTCVCTPTQQVQVMDAKISNIAQAGSKPIGDLKTEIEEHVSPELKTIAQRMCAWAAPEYGGTGEGWDRKAMLVAQVAIYSSIIALNTYVQNQNYKIARAYADISIDKHNRFKNAYANLEKKLLAEASNTHEPVVPYSEAKARGVNATNFSFGSAKSELTSYAKKYALCIDDTYDYSKSQALMRDDNINFNYRDEETYTNRRSDKRWNRRSDILNLGRNNHATAYSYAKNASSAFGDFANAVQGIGNGISGLLGYMFNRNETIYPAQFSQASRLASGAIVTTPGASTPVGF